ncbi:MAG: hypothetical protein H0W52_16345 [Rubrobacteraceae bacterium]|nr:hypothetical protein [Rubrobacteraceae bacterium]
MGKWTKAVRKKLTRSEVSGASGYEEAVRGYGVPVFSRSTRMPYSLAGAVEAKVWKRDRSVHGEARRASSRRKFG